MKSGLRFLLTIVTIASMLLGPAALVSAGQGPDQIPAPLYLKGRSDQIPAGLMIAGAVDNQPGYYVIQFAGPVEQAWKDAVTAEGAELLDYLPDFAFKARMNPGQARKIAALDIVARVEDFHPAYKLSPELARSEPGIYTVRIERGSDRALARQAVAATGVEVLSADEDTMIIVAGAAQLDAIANVLDVAWVDNFRMYETHNEYGAGSVMGSAVANSLGYDGSTQIVAVADTGIGGGTAATAHRDIPSTRVTAIYSWTGAAGGCFSSIVEDGAIDVDSGHGTHTAGSVLSGGDANGLGKGTAPGAKLVFQAVENYAVIAGICKALYGYTDGYYLVGLPTDIRQIFQQAYDAGARIHSNSWGSAAAGDYTADSANADSFVWTNKDMVITFSAGNEGVDANSDGIIDNDSTGSPATAKNVITVGASENARASYPCDSNLSYTTCASQGGQNNPFTYGAAWPADYPANPIAGDNSTGNPEQMAAFSSRGPADDGRIKPDVVAPGTWVLSTYSDLYQQGYDASANPRNNAWQYDGWGFPYDSYYKYMGGTSMSNPLAAGGAAVIKDYFQKVYGITASAALVKGVLVNTAVDLGDENNDGANDNDFPIPNNHEGWGRVNLATATNGSVRYDQNSSLTTNARISYSVVTDGSAPLKITVAWSDYPSTETAAINLVNDLDLSVSGPAGTYLGNVFAGGWSAAGGSADRRNNLENVYIANPGAGTYTITVNGYNVPNGPQPFALVVTGGQLGAPATPTPTPSPTPAPTQNTGFLSPTLNTAVTKSAGDNNGYEITPANAYADGNGYAEDRNSGSGSGTTCTSTKRDKHQFYTYNISLPTNATVKGIEVKLDAKAASASGSPQLCVQLSWDNGATWTAGQNTAYLTTTETTYILGGAANTWGRTWTVSNLANNAFRVRITNLGTTTTNTFYLDYIAVNVTYQ